MGSLGSALADVVTGYAYWAPATLIIKGVEGFLVGWFSGRSKQPPNHLKLIWSFAVGAITMAVGYFIAGAIMYGGAAALADTPANLVQGIGSVVVALPLTYALKKLRFLDREKSLTSKQERGREVHLVTLIPGDGIGPEITESVKEILSSAKAPVEFEEVQAGEGALESEGELLPLRRFSRWKTKVGLKGPITTPIGKGFRSVNVSLRQIFNLYACVRPYRSMPGIASRYENVDIVVVRENTEDLYKGVEFAPNSKETRTISELTGGAVSEDAAISIKAITAHASERIGRFAFEYAKKHGRKK